MDHLIYSPDLKHSDLFIPIQNKLHSQRFSSPEKLLMFQRYSNRMQKLLPCSLEIPHHRPSKHKTERNVEPQLFQKSQLCKAQKITLKRSLKINIHQKKSWQCYFYSNNQNKTQPKGCFLVSKQEDQKKSMNYTSFTWIHVT